MPGQHSPPLALLLRATLARSSVALAQQQTGYTVSWSQGRTAVSRSRSDSASASLNGVELLVPSTEFVEANVRRITRPDGSVAYEILDLNKPFGSYAESRTREQENGNATRLFSTFSGIGYSVFHP